MSHEFTKQVVASSGRSRGQAGGWPAIAVRHAVGLWDIDRARRIGIDRSVRASFGSNRRARVHVDRATTAIARGSTDTAVLQLGQSATPDDLPPVTIRPTRCRSAFRA
ncbi:MAG: hypothetical protein QM770_20995 [Tepidisphaeraceae bacterium]